MISAVKEQENAKRKEMTDKAAGEVVMLDDDDLENAAGGIKVVSKKYKCGTLMRERFETKKHFWECLYNNLCSLTWNWS